MRTDVEQIYDIVILKIAKIYFLGRKNQLPSVTRAHSIAKDQPV
jgi:hypothetical protein